MLCDNFFLFKNFKKKRISYRSKYLYHYKSSDHHEGHIKEKD